MEVIKIVTGPLEENCYVLKNDSGSLIVDPGDDYLQIKEAVGDSKLLGILITHSHFDHIGALRHFLGKRGLKIFKRSSVLEKEYQVGDFTFSVLFTPGHSKDSISFYFEESKEMFVGDFVFKETVGRCDLPGGSMDEMIESISKLKKYPTDILLHPGHGEDTTLGYEVDTNSFFR